MKLIIVLIYCSLCLPNTTASTLIPVPKIQPENIKMEYVNYSNEDMRYLALNIYHEGRGEDLHGRMAIAFVVINRTFHRRFPDSIKEVVIQPDQFSWYWDGKSDTPRDKPIWDAAKDTAKLCLELYNTGARVSHYDPLEDSPDWIVDGALFYYASSGPNKIKEPYWIAAENMTETVKLGHHSFFKL